MASRRVLPGSHPEKFCLKFYAQQSYLTDPFPQIGYFLVLWLEDVNTYLAFFVHRSRSHVMFRTIWGGRRLLGFEDAFGFFIKKLFPTLPVWNVSVLPRAAAIWQDKTQQAKTDGRRKKKRRWFSCPSFINYGQGFHTVRVCSPKSLCWRLALQDVIGKLEPLRGEA